ncbi:hypothetical protein [Aliikangiella coralliicola]|uniref:Uncharacterized protein n=1 Tax=Aliikangiella coralliicola TaxID=2592383 RepID=A0A545UIP8_9GAMM|nr:hypothetical protein [Aliikangiella coralliicola]TQV89338.1 hypothetical protein FLL46_00190 [Aliikangiella coralliicola]
MKKIFCTATSLVLAVSGVLFSEPVNSLPEGDQMELTCTHISYKDGAVFEIIDYYQTVDHYVDESDCPDAETHAGVQVSHSKTDTPHCIVTTHIVNIPGEPEGAPD